MYCFYLININVRTFAKKKNKKNNTSQHNIITVFSPLFVMVDYELAIYNAIREVLIYSEIKACLFHYGQALLRKRKTIGLSWKEYNNDEHIQRLFRQFVGLAFLPLPQVVSGFIKMHYVKLKVDNNYQKNRNVVSEQIQKNI